MDSTARKLNKMYYLHNFCFLCLTSGKNVASQDSKNVEWQEKLKYFVPVQILEKSKIPKHICDHCVESVSYVYKFRAKCLENIKIFNEYVEKLTQEPGSYKYLSEISTDLSLHRKSGLLNKTLNNRRGTNMETSHDMKVKRSLFETSDFNSSENQPVEILKGSERIEQAEKKLNDTMAEISLKKEIIEELITGNERVRQSANENQIEEIMNDSDNVEKIYIKCEKTWDDTEIIETSGTKSDESTYRHLNYDINSREKICDDFTLPKDKEDINENIEKTDQVHLNVKDKSKGDVKNEITEEFIIKEESDSIDVDSHEYIESGPLLDRNACFSIGPESIAGPSTVSKNDPGSTTKLQIEENDIQDRQLNIDGPSKYSTKKLQIRRANRKFHIMENHTVNLQQLNIENINLKIKEEIFESENYEQEETEKIQEYETRPMKIEDTIDNSGIKREYYIEQVFIQESYAKQEINEELILKDDLFECETCDLTFSTKLQSDNHAFKCKNNRKSIGAVNHKSDDSSTKSTTTSTHIEKKQHVCDVCQKVFSGLNYLNNHLRTHSGEKQNKCDVCKKSFSSKSVFDIHYRVHTGEKPYECGVCKKKFRVKSSLIGHERIHTGEKPYECGICKKSFSKKGHLDKHILVHTGEKPYKCDVCQKAFARINTLKIHQRTHSGEKPYGCNVCGKTFCQKSNLDQHERIHTADKLYECGVCHKSFTGINNLKIHEGLHSGKKPYECYACGKKFSQKITLDQHKRIHTGERPYECDVCKKSFGQKTTLDRHKRIHTGEKPYNCGVCQRSFVRLSVLKNHQRTHSDKKSHECDVCKKSISTESDLDVHSIHTGEQSYEGCVCQKSLTGIDDLKILQGIHSRKRPYECDVCGKTFRQKITLDHHERIHTGEKPYECDVCKKSFSQKISLDRHKRIHTGEKPYKCGVCQKAFARPYVLKNHQRTHSDEKPKEYDVPNHFE